MKHKWYNEIVAWANRAEIESNGGCGWFRDASPDWNDDDYEFRIKPSVKEPQYLYVYRNHLSEHLFRTLEYVNKSETYIGKIKLEDEE
jgi:hypothetical protein